MCAENIEYMFAVMSCTTEDVLLYFFSGLTDLGGRLAFKVWRSCVQHALTMTIMRRVDSRGAELKRSRQSNSSSFLSCNVYLCRNKSPPFLLSSLTDINIQVKSEQKKDFSAYFLFVDLTFLPLRYVSK